MSCPVCLYSVFVLHNLIFWFISFLHSREWDGDLKKLPNIKVKKLSVKDSLSIQKGNEEGKEDSQETTNQDDVSEH